MTSDSSWPPGALSPRKARLVVALLLLLALALRAPLLSAHRLHEDEALYASWALSAGQDPALVSAFVDKPPLLLYAVYGSSLLLGTSETALRLPNLVASVTSIALLYAIGARVYGRNVGIAAAALYAVSPLAIVFSPTIFADPLLVLWMLVGIWASVTRRPLLGGVALGLAYATKQQGVLLVPLIVGLALVLESGRHAGGSVPGTDQPRRSPVWSRVAAMLFLIAGSAPIIGAVTWWDSLRWQTRPSFWDRSLTTYGGLELAQYGTWWERLREWGGLLSQVFGSPLLNLLLLSVLPLLLWAAMVCPSRKRVVEGRNRNRVSLSVLAYVMSYVLLHVVVTFQVWDRYALIPVPCLCLLVAASSAHWVPWVERRARRLRGAGSDTGYARTRPGLAGWVGVIFVVLLTHATWVTAAGLPTMGANQDAYDGIEQLAAYARDRLTPDTTLYYHWLGWHYGYYLRDVPGERIWYPDGDALAEMVLEGGPAVSVVAFPAWRDEQPIRDALATFELSLLPEFVARRADGSPSLTLYSLHSTQATVRWEQVP